MTHKEQITNLALTIARLQRELQESESRMASLHAAIQCDLRELVRLRAVAKTCLRVASKHRCRKAMLDAVGKL